MSTILHKNTLGLLIASLLATTGLAHAADTAQINITATVEANTCTMEQADQSQTVELGHVTLDRLKAGTTAEKEFGIHLTGCSDSASTVKVTSTSAASDENPEVFATTGTASGVGVKITAGDDKEQLIPGGKGVDYKLALDDEGNQTLSFAAQLVKTSEEMTAGDATANVTLNFEYQ